MCLFVSDGHLKRRLTFTHLFVGLIACFLHHTKQEQHVTAQEEHLNPSKLEIEAVALAEAGNLEAALLKIDEAIKQAPNHPSPLNNK